MKGQFNRTRITFAISFFGAAYIGGLTLIAGNTWVTVYERASAGFLVLWLITHFAGSAVQSIFSQKDQKVGLSFDQSLPPEIPDFSNSPADPPDDTDFIPWTLPPVKTPAESHEHETKR